MSHLHADSATLPEVRAFLDAHPYAVLPVGATEQHGPHLPLTTDNDLARAYAERIVARSGGLLLPTLPFGYSWTWRDHPGTVTLAFDTFLSVIHDVAAGLARTGVKALLVVTGHEANRGPLKYALRERLADRVELDVLTLFYPGMETVLAEAASPAWHRGILHADEVETSMMLAVRPEAVHPERAVRDYPEPPETYGMTRTTMGDLMDSGVFGDATVATAENGERWLELMADEAARLWRGFLREHRTPGAP